VRALVCGGREWSNGESIRKALIDFNPRVVIHGNCRGADKLAGIEAKKLGIEVVVFPAQWNRYGRAAGPIRNQQMLDEGEPEIVLAFHDDIAESVGTVDMVGRAMKAQLPVYMYDE
jgi:hypothetical protein